MLSYEIFDRYFVQSLAPRLGIPVESDLAKEEWYEDFEDMKDDRFVQVMKAARVECESRFDFSAAWALKRAKEIAHAESLAPSQAKALPSSDDRAWAMTDAELLESRKKLLELSKFIGRGGSRSELNFKTPGQIAMETPVDPEQYGQC